MFTANSMLANLWAKWINKGTYTMEQVPNISNLRDVVTQIINGMK